MIFSNDPVTMQALRNCGLLKLFMILGMRAQLDFLEYCLRAWDVQGQYFKDWKAHCHYRC